MSLLNQSESNDQDSEVQIRRYHVNIPINYNVQSARHETGGFTSMLRFTGNFEIAEEEKK